MDGIDEVNTDINFESIGKVTKRYNNSTFVETDAEDLKKSVTKLRLAGVKRITAITGTDNGKSIEIIYHFDKDNHIISLKTRISRKDSEIDTITTIFSGAKLFERELSEMLNVHVEGNREPKNVFLSEDSPKAPLRKNTKSKTKA